jgi:hypothetical protein
MHYLLFYEKAPDYVRRESAHQAAHRRIALDPAEEVVVLGSEHGSSVAALRAPAYY